MLHGIKTNLLLTGARAIMPLATAIIGIVCTAPAAQAEVKAKLIAGVVGSNNGQTFTSKLTGAAGNGTSLTLVDPAANNATLAISVNGTAITASLATGSGGAISTTATQLATAIAAHAAANALIGVANTGASTGSGVLTARPRAVLAGGIDEAFPLDTPVLVTDVRAALSLAGATGTLAPTLSDIADQASPVAVVVRVAVDAEDQDDLVIGGSSGGLYTGMQALLAAEARTGVKPRILGAPGLDTQAVTTALAAVAKKLNGRVYAAGEGADVSAAIDYRRNFGAPELTLIWPNFTGADGFAGKAAAVALGQRAAIDEDQGWHKTLSNVPVYGVTGISKDVSFDIQDPSTDAQLLNDNGIVTLIRSNGFRFWGNRTTSDEPLLSFESTVRTYQVLRDEMAEGCRWAIDRPLTKGLITDILETINARGRALIAEGKLIGFRCWFDPAQNSAVDLAAGKLTLDYEFTPAAPLEGLTLNQRLTDKYYAEGFAIAA